MLHRLLILSALIACVGSLHAQCPGGRCGPPAFAPAQPSFLPPASYQPFHAPAAPAPAQYSWVSDGDGGYALFLGDVQAGWQDKFGTYYRRLGKNRFTEAETPPVSAPAAAKVARRGSCCPASGCKCDPDDCQCGKTKGLCCDGCNCAVNSHVKLVGDDMNFGVETDKLGKSPTYTKNGRKCSKKDVIEALEKGLVDDSSLPRLTVIGPEGERKRVLADMDSSPALSPFKGRFLVQSYAPDNWALQNMGFVTTGSPTIYAQRADGVVLHRQDGYDGPEKLAAALRKADPAYDKAKDPDLAKPSLLNFDFKSLPWPGIALGGLAALLLLRKGDAK